MVVSLNLIVPKFNPIVNMPFLQKKRLLYSLLNTNYYFFAFAAFASLLDCFHTAQKVPATNIDV